jgi:hypothetical protein
MKTHFGVMGPFMEELHCIPTYELFYPVDLDIVKQYKYIFMVINHYSKMVEVQLMTNHGALTIIRFMENEIICGFWMPRYVLTNNGTKWVAEFSDV